jgi:diguanylate cyclase (GGDEF)-like protein/PAS domain S-box-containing protein
VSARTEQPAAAAPGAVLVGTGRTPAALRRLLGALGVAVVPAPGAAGIDTVLFALDGDGDLPRLRQLANASPPRAVVAISATDPGGHLRAAAIDGGAQDCVALDELDTGLLRHVLRHAAATFRRQCIWRRAVAALEASERRFRDIFEHGTGFVCIHDLDGILLAVNPAAAAALGREPGQLLGTPLREVMPPERRFLFDRYLEQIREAGDSAGHLHVLDGAGELRTWQYRSRLFTGGDGTYATCHAQDITALRAAERALQHSEHRLRTIADALPMRILYMDAAQRLQFANEASIAASGRRGGGAAGVRELLGADRHERYRRRIEQALAGQRVVFEDAEGSGEAFRCYEVSLIPERDSGEGRVVGVHLVMQDITTGKQEEQRLLQLARSDPLSGLLNRAGFQERLENAVARSRDQHSLLAMLYLDIDHFKQVNDVHGHAVGDVLICAFAQRLAAHVRASDLVARLGGDEFAVVMEALPDAAHAEAVAAGLVAAMQQPFELGEGIVARIGTSIGVALARAPRGAPAQLLACADACLYQAKRAGRGNWRLVELDAE